MSQPHEKKNKEMQDARSDQPQLRAGEADPRDDQRARFRLGQEWVSRITNDAEAEELAVQGWQPFAEKKSNPLYRVYHQRVVDEIRKQLVARWPPRTSRERNQLERNIRFFDEQCDYIDDFDQGAEPSEVAEANIDAAQ